jgi:nucleotide-binding universal stress UspA family protein
MYKHILIPTDGTPLSTAAVDEGLRFARAVGAKATVLAVVEPFRLLATDSAQISQTRMSYSQHAKTAAARHLASAADQAKTLGVPCTCVELEHEFPYLAIIETAANHKCDLIAMASHGRRGVSALILGSETTKVLTHSTVPVLVYR